MPSDPIYNLPGRVATDAGELVAAIAPVAFALLVALVVLTLAGRLIRGML